MQTGAIAWVLVLAGCEKAAAITGEVSVGSDSFTPKRCVDAARAYAMSPGTLYFEGNPGGLFVTPRNDADPLVMYHPPRVNTTGKTDPGALVIAADRCSTYTLADGHLTLDCDAASDREPGRRLRADLRFGGVPVTDAELLETARIAVRAAAQLLANARPQAITGKSNPRDLVTEWDVRTEELIRTILEERAPGVPVLGEEGGQGAGDAETRWLVDPIDGTVNFVHGLPLWSISIALEHAGVARVGVVAAPLLGWWFEAARGGGAHDATGAPLAVSRVPRVDQALLTTGFPYDRATHPVNNFADWEHMQRRAGACRRLGCASLDLCVVARGWLDGYWERRLQPWDVAAGALIVQEAGGIVTNTTGGPFDPHAGEVCASNGAIHDELIAELARVQRSV